MLRLISGLAIVATLGFFSSCDSGPREQSVPQTTTTPDEGTIQQSFEEVDEFSSKLDILKEKERELDEALNNL